MTLTLGVRIEEVIAQIVRGGEAAYLDETSQVQRCRAALQEGYPSGAPILKPLQVRRRTRLRPQGNRRP